MRKIFQIDRLAWLTQWLVAGMMCLNIAPVTAGTDTTSAELLHARYAELGPLLSNNQFKRPLYLDSVESSNDLKGDIYAVVDFPFAIVNDALDDPTHWCDVLILHLTYSDAYNFEGRLDMQAYLATIGTGKVGFTSAGNESNAQPDYIGGVRGAVERNTMRYYLAIDAYLGALATPPAGQLEKRLQSWFASTEQYPRQLHEIDRISYLDMKRSEYLRQQNSL